MTNEEKIKAMSTEEMVELFKFADRCDYCVYRNSSCDVIEDCKDGMLEWLKKEADNDGIMEWLKQEAKDEI